MEIPSQGGGAVRGVIAFIGIGSNQGGPVDACRTAIRELANIPEARPIRCSSLFRTEPVGPRDQPWFINAVAEVRTSLSPRQLLGALKEIERRMGRAEGPKWGPRFIDLDLLLYGQDVVHEHDLIIPHPELHRRRFVLVPLCEIASYAIHPAFGISARGLLDRLEDPSRVERYDQAAGTEGTRAVAENDEHRRLRENDDITIGNRHYSGVLPLQADQGVEGDPGAV